MITQNKTNSLLKGNDKKKSIMKTIKLNKILLLLLGMVVLNACVQDDDFSTPDTTITEPELEGPVITLNALAGFLIQQQNDDENENNSEIDYNNETSVYTFEFPAGESEYVSGYVVSSDEGGNFFEEIILQDNFENPTIGIKLLLDTSPLFTRYEVGRKIYIKLHDLSIGVTNGVFTIGVLNSAEVDKIPAPLEEEFIARSSEKQDIVPLPVQLSDVTDRMTNLFVSIEDAQFSAGQVLVTNPLTFAAEPLDDFDGERVLEDCQSGSSIIFSTSTFADFKGLALPANRGQISGVLTKNFFGDEFNLSVNSPEDISFNNDLRCDPILIQDFNSATDGENLNIDGWINYAEEGSELWTEQVFSGNGYAEFTAFSTGDSSNIGWLISPSFDLDAQDGEILTFQTQHAFPDAGHDAIKLFISTDFDGDEDNITSSTWIELDFTSSLEDDFDEWYTFVDSGQIDISSYTGTGYIAFRYTGSDTSNMNTTIHVDNVAISIPE